MGRRRFLIDAGGLWLACAIWLRETLNRESEPFGVGMDMHADDRLALRWGRRDS